LAVIRLAQIRVTTTEIPIESKILPVLFPFGGTMLYLYLKWLHVLFAILAVGANATYGIWLAHASRDPDNLPYTLKGIKLLDDRIANPSYGLLLLTGLGMVFTLPLPLTTPWLLTALILYVALVLVGLLGYTPTLRNQIRILEAEGYASSNYQAQAQRGTILGIILAVIAIGIVYLMVVKPALWA
jgi:uncharacterized membrane protein